jgi:hypothetical protein
MRRLVFGKPLIELFYFLRLLGNDLLRQALLRKSGSTSVAPAGLVA